LELQQVIRHTSGTRRQWLLVLVLPVLVLPVLVLVLLVLWVLLLALPSCCCCAPLGDSLLPARSITIRDMHQQAPIVKRCIYAVGAAVPG
jgi:hypothetical protein